MGKNDDQESFNEILSQINDNKITLEDFTLKVDSIVGGLENYFV